MSIGDAKAAHEQLKQNEPGTTRDMALVYAAARADWLPKHTIVDILCNLEAYNVQALVHEKPVVRPPSGSIVFYNRKKLNRWRADGFAYKSNVDLHVKVTYQGEPKFTCCYAHCAEPGLELLNRRAYYLLSDPVICMVHYLQIESKASKAAKSRASKKQKSTLSTTTTKSKSKRRSATKATSASTIVMPQPMTQDMAPTGLLSAPVPSHLFGSNQQSQLQRSPMLTTSSSQDHLADAYYGSVSSLSSPVPSALPRLSLVPSPQPLDFAPVSPFTPIFNLPDVSGHSMPYTYEQDTSLMPELGMALSEPMLDVKENTPRGSDHLAIATYAPTWDLPTGGSTVIVCVPNVPPFHSLSHAVFDMASVSVPVQTVTHGVYQFVVPPCAVVTSLNSMFYLTDNKSISTEQKPFQYRVSTHTNTAASSSEEQSLSIQMNHVQKQHQLCLQHIAGKLASLERALQPKTNNDKIPKFERLCEDAMRVQFGDQQWNIVLTLSMRDVLNTVLAGRYDAIETMLLRLLQQVLDVCHPNQQVSAMARPLCALFSVTDERGWTALHCCAALKMPRVLAALLQLGLAVDVQDSRGWTPLHHAVAAADVSTVTTLLSNGAHDDIVDTKGIDAVALSDQMGVNDVTDVFVDLHADTASLVGSDIGDVTSLMLDAKDDVMSGDDGKTTPDLQAIDLRVSFASLTLKDLGIDTDSIENPEVSEDEFEQSVLNIQRKIRWWLYRRHDAAQKLQAGVRGMLARRNLKRMRHSALTIQTVYRQRQKRRHLNNNNQ